MDTIALLGHVGADLSGLRREQMKPALKQEFHALCFTNWQHSWHWSKHDRKYNNKLSRRETWNNKSYNSYKSNGGKRQPFLWKGSRQNVETETKYS